MKHNSIILIIAAVVIVLVVDMVMYLKLQRLDRECNANGGVIMFDRDGHHHCVKSFSEVFIR